ncbi:hypothetical protein Tco_0028914 [Tanacetum coccineum]
MRKLLVNHGNLHERVKSLCFELDEVQKAMDGDPSNVWLREEEAFYLQAFNDALIDEERSRIDAIVDSTGVRIEGEHRKVTGGATS